MRQCKICGVKFQARTNYKCCSPQCSKMNEQRRMKAWNTAHPERIAEFKLKFIESLRTA